MSLSVRSANQPRSKMLQRRSLLWRIHFWAALLSSPFLIAAILTGLLYTLSPQIEDYLYRKIDYVTPQGRPRPLDEAIVAAIQVAPNNYELYSVIAPFTDIDSVKIAFIPKTQMPSKSVNASDHASHGASVSTPPNPAHPVQNLSAFLRPSFGLPARSLVIYVDPYNAQVLGQLLQSERFTTWSKKLHSTYLQDGYRWIIEFAASWTLVMLVTGVFLWMPILKEKHQEHERNSRRRWRYWHATIGISMSIMSAAILVTGLTWSKNTGEQIRWARDALDQKSPRIPAHFRSIIPDHNHSGYDQGHNFNSQTMIPVPTMISWQQAWQSVKSNAPDIAIELRAPLGQDGFWRANHVDKGDPTKRFDMLLDAYSGQPLFYSGWDDQPLFGKATAIGIPFHRGEFGIWNQILLIAFGISLLFSFVSGWIMYFKRFRVGMPILPQLLPGTWKTISPWALLGTICMMISMPLLAISSLFVVGIEAIVFIRKTYINTSHNIM